MTLNRLRGCYVALVLADQALWHFTALSVDTAVPVQAVALLFRLTLLVVALLPPRFRLAQVRAARWVANYAFLAGFWAAWLGHSTSAGKEVFSMATPTPALSDAAYAMSLFMLVVLIVSAVLLPRVRRI